MSLEYVLATNAFSGEVTHTIEKDRLVVRYAKSGRTEGVPLTSIREINLRQDMPGVFNVYVKRHGGSTLMIPSRHFHGIGRFDDRGAEYAAFIRELLDATAKASSTTRFTAGSSMFFVAGWLLVAVGVFFSIAVAVASFSRGLPPLRMLFFLPAAIFMGLGFARQGRARAFDPASPPPELMPA